MRRDGFRPGERLFQWIGREPWFSPVDVVNGPGRTPHLGKVNVRWANGVEEWVPTRTLHRDSVQLRAWGQARAEFAQAVEAVIHICAERRLVYEGPECQALPEYKRRTQAWADCQRLAAATEGLHPYGRNWSKA